MRAKSLTLTPVLLFLSGLMAAGIFLTISGGGLSWGGVVLAAAPLPTMVGYLMATERLARTSANLPVALLISGVGAVMSLFSAGLALPSLLALGAFGLLIWYIFGYSRYGRSPSTALKLGKTLPDFELEDVDGEVVPSSMFRATPSLLLFYRGNWCPLCMAQIREVAEAYKRLAGLGVEVVLVSPQPKEETERLAAKFDVPFRFLVDRDLTAARALDIFAEGGTPVGIDAIGYGQDTVLPTVIATDEEGRVIFLDETDNYRVRPEPETFLAIFENTLPKGQAA